MARSNLTPSSLRRIIAAMPPRDVPYLRRVMGVIFQDFKLIRTRTVQENVSLVPRVLGESGVQQQRRTFQVLKWVGLPHRMNALPRELSSGEQQLGFANSFPFLCAHHGSFDNIAALNDRKLVRFKVGRVKDNSILTKACFNAMLDSLWSRLADAIPDPDLINVVFF